MFGDLRLPMTGLILMAAAACEPAPETSKPPASDQPPSHQAAEQNAADPESTFADLAARAPKGRLPDTVRPLAYRLAMTIDPREPDFSGSVTITIKMEAPADGFWLHGKNITVDQTIIEAADGTLVKGFYREVLPSGVSWVGFGQTLPAGQHDVTLVYSAEFDKNLAGLFRVEEQGEAYALAKSESIQARKYLPGFDEPGFKAPFTVSLRVPEGYVAIANTPERVREPTGDGMEWVHFAPTRPLSTFLLSLSVARFDVVERDALPPNAIRDRAVPLRGFARKGKGGELGLILDITKDFVEIFEEALGVPYPYAKLDIVAAPQWPSGATELAGAITYREQLILVGDTPAPGARRRLVSLHAHELAHMWFGDLVTPPWWDDLWLKEGFATWGEPLVLTQWEPDGGHGLDAIVDGLNAMGRDALASARSVREPIFVNEDIRNAYTPIPYGKGMAIIRMVENYFGPDRFRRAIGDYIRTHEDGTADSPRFFDTIGQVTGVPELTAAFRSFVEQPGVPLLETDLDCAGEDGPHVTLKQSRYRPLGSAIDPATRWTIPACVRFDGTDGPAQTCAILTEEETRVSLETDRCPTWLMPNARGLGYYRFALNADAWSALRDTFQTLDTGEALVIVDNAFAGFEGGTTGAQTLGTLVTAAAATQSRHVAAAPLKYFDRYAEALGRGEQAAALRAFAAGLYAPRLGVLSDPQGEDEILLKTRLESFLALTAEDPALRATLSDAASRFIGFEGTPDLEALNSDQYETALTVAVQDQGAAFVDRLIEARARFDDPRFDAASAVALGRVRDPELAAQVRDYALSDVPGSREAYAMIGALMTEAETREDTWTWLKANIARVVERIPAQWRRRLPTLTTKFCDTSREGEIRAFFTENAGLMPGYQRQLTQAVETLSLCEALKTRLEAERFGLPE